MQGNYFVREDDFEGIMRSHFPDIDNIKYIKTGWTNFVYLVSANGKKYFFRFPRNDFFANAIVKECKFTQFVSDKISLMTPDLKLYYNKNRPYSLHERISGDSLEDCYNDLSENEKTILADDICKFLKELSEIDLKTLDDFQSVSGFLDDLSLVSQNNYDIKIHDKLKTLEKNEPCVAHGDLNPGNLILRDHKLVAVIDFAFAGPSTAMVDLSRIIGRCPEEFKDFLVSSYKKLLNIDIDFNKLKEIQEMWKYVDSHYIMYIKQYHPWIDLPTLSK